MTEQIKREECHVGIYPYCIEFENGKAIRNCYACIEKYGYAKGVYEENQKNKKAWEEVLTELEEVKEDVMELNIEYYLGELAGLKKAIDIINKHLAEIEE